MKSSPAMSSWCRSLPSLPHSSSAVPRMSCHGEGMQVAPVTPTLIQCSTTHVLPWRGDAGRSRHSHTHPVQYHACPAMARGCRSLPSLPHSSSAVPRMSCHDEGMQVAPVTPTLIQCSTTHVLPWRGDAGRSRHSHTHPVQFYAFLGGQSLIIFLMHYLLRFLLVLFFVNFKKQCTYLSQKILHYYNLFINIVII